MAGNGSSNVDDAQLQRENQVLIAIVALNSPAISAIDSQNATNYILKWAQNPKWDELMEAVKKLTVEQLNTLFCTATLTSKAVQSRNCLRKQNHEPSRPFFSTFTKNGWTCY